MDRFVSTKIKDILNIEHKYEIFKIVGAYMSFDKTYMAHIFFKTNNELSGITEEDRKKIKWYFNDYFEKNGYIHDEVEEIILYFDSDENVQKNYRGNYFYATR